MGADARERYSVVCGVYCTPNLCAVQRRGRARQFTYERDARMSDLVGSRNLWTVERAARHWGVSGEMRKPLPGCGGQLAQLSTRGFRVEASSMRLVRVWGVTGASGARVRSLAMIPPSAMRIF